MRNTYKILVLKPDGEGLPERPGHKLHDNIKNVLKIGHGVVLDLTR
jgi:hypothetical protein